MRKLLNESSRTLKREDLHNLIFFPLHQICSEKVNWIFYDLQNFGGKKEFRDENLVEFLLKKNPVDHEENVKISKNQKDIFWGNFKKFVNTLQ